MVYSKFQIALMKILGLPIITDTKYAVAEAQKKELSEKLASVTSQLGLEKAENKKLKDQINQPRKREEVAKKLLESAEEIRKEDVGTLFALGGIYRMMYGVKIPKGRSEFDIRTKIGKRIEFSDKNDVNPFVFGDINISSKGYFVITDKDKKIKAMFPVPKGMFAKTSSMFNQLRRGRILLGIDENGKYVQEMDDVEINLPVWNDTLQRYEDSEILRVNAREKLIEILDKLNFQEDINEKHEIIIDAQKRDIRDLKRNNASYEKRVKIYESDMSRVEKDNLEMTSKVSFMQSRIQQLQEISAMKEALSEKFEGALYKVFDKLEDVAGKTAKEKAMAEIKDVLDYLDKRKITGEQKQVLPMVKPHV